MTSTARLPAPLRPSRPTTLDFPVGQVRRVAASGGDDNDVDETRTEHAQALAAWAPSSSRAGVSRAASIQYVQPPAVGLTSFPKVQLIDVDGKPLTVAAVESEYNVGTDDLFLFNYPLRNEPNFLLNLAPRQRPGALAPRIQAPRRCPGGVGTNGSIVAYQRDLPALGLSGPRDRLLPAWNVPEDVRELQQPPAVLHPLLLPRLDLRRHANSAANLTGPAVLPLPQAVLVTDASGYIYATGLTHEPAGQRPPELVAGRLRRRDDQPADRETPVILCSFPS